MLNVICLKTGDKYPTEYVYNLKSMVDRNLTIPHRFICYTDDPLSTITCKPVGSKSLYGWWNKVWFFSNQIGLDGRVLYFDLDMLIVDNIDDIAMFDAGFASISQWKGLNLRYRDGVIFSKYNTSCMLWETCGNRSFVWNDLRDADVEYWRSDQDWVGFRLQSGESFPSKWFKAFEQCPEGPPKGCKVVICNKHDNHTTDHIPWVNKVWR